MRNFTCFLLTAAWSPAVVSAQTADTTRSHAIDEVVVYSTRTEVNRNAVPLTISVVGRTEIENSSESSLLPVLSQHVPGLFVTRKGVTGFGVSDGAAGSVSIRGVGGGDKVLMLMDGQPQWAGIFGHSLADMYVASDAERVEVIRGPGSLIYGSNAMGGVVNVITRKPKTDGALTGGRLLGGSYGTQKYMIDNARKSGKFSHFLSVNHDRTDGHRPDSWFRITNGFTNLGYQINDHLKVAGDVNLAAFKSQNPGEVTAPVIDNVIDIFRGSSSLGFENRYDKTDGALRLFYSWGNHTINDGYEPGGTSQESLFRSNDHNYGAMLYQTVRLFRGNRITAGVDYKNWGGRAWNDYFDGRPDRGLIDATDGEIKRVTIHETAGYLIAAQDFGRLVSLHAGVRYEKNSRFGGIWVPQAGFSVRPAEATTIKASVSKGFRSPNLRELYMFRPANRELQPEQMVSYEVSVGQTLLGGALRVEAAGFYIDGKNMIQAVNMKNINTGTFVNKGVELDAHYRIVRGLQFSGNYSYLHTDKPILYAPEHKLFSELTYAPGRFSLNANFQWISGLYTRTGNAPSLETYGLLNARAAYRFGTRERGIQLFVKGENLTDTGYSILYGFPMPGIVVLAGLDFSF